MLGTMNVLQLALPEERANPVTEIPSMNIAKYWLLCEPSGPDPQLLGSWAQEKANSFLSIHLRRKDPWGANSLVERSTSPTRAPCSSGWEDKGCGTRSTGCEREPWVLALDLLTAMYLRTCSSSVKGEWWCLPAGCCEVRDSVVKHEAMYLSEQSRPARNSS